jgi:hypothetical protein
LPPDYIITSFAKVSGYLVIFAYNGSFTYNGVSTVDSDYCEAKAFFWNYVDSDPTYTKYLNDNFVSEAIPYLGTVACFTSGRNVDFSVSGTSKLKVYQGNEFETVAEFRTALPIRGGVFNPGQEIQWNSAGSVMSWNNIFSSNKLNIIAEGSGTSSGMLNANLGQLNISSGATTSGGLQLVSSSSTYYFQSYFSTVMAEPSWPLRSFGKAKRVRINWAKTCSGGLGITVALISDRGGTFTNIINSPSAYAVTTPNLSEEFELDTAGNPLPTFQSVGLSVAYSGGLGSTDAPIIDSVEAEFEMDNIG